MARRLPPPLTRAACPPPAPHAPSAALRGDHGLPVGRRPPARPCHPQSRRRGPGNLPSRSQLQTIVGDPERAGGVRWSVVLLAKARCGVPLGPRPPCSSRIRARVLERHRPEQANLWPRPSGVRSKHARFWPPCSLPSGRLSCQVRVVTTRTATRAGALSRCFSGGALTTKTRSQCSSARRGGEASYRPRSNLCNPMERHRDSGSMHPLRVPAVSDSMLFGSE